MTLNGHRPASHVALANRSQPLSKCSIEPVRWPVLGLGSGMKRRNFLGVLGGAAAVWPLLARAQQAMPMRPIAVFTALAADDAEGQARITAFVQRLQELGWTDGRNMQIEYRWGAGDVSRIRRYAAELVALAPDVILANGGTIMGPLQQVARDVRIVFVNVPDPVGAGFVTSLARPGGNITGFTVYEYGMSGKWLELLKQIAPTVTRAAVLRDPTNPSGTGQWGAIQAVAPSLGMDLRPIDVRNAADIENAVAVFARQPNSGLVVVANALAIVHREVIMKVAAQHRLPAVYPYRFFTKAGGLISYGTDSVDQYRRAATYVSRILNGEKPADLPVQAPTKYDIVINLITAKALGLTVPPTLLARADEVIE
jgi:putative tryptophan/tyrosine transport system substrate-binding protein